MQQFTILKTLTLAENGDDYLLTLQLVQNLLHNYTHWILKARSL